MALNAADIRGRVRYIEPTNIEQRTINGHKQTAIIPSNDLVLNDLEDYCIAVDLEVYMPDRKSCGLSNETGEMYMIHYSASNGNVSFMHGTSGVLTTNFTDVNVLEPEASTAEMFGIESISITYDSWLYPNVTIRFIDVRGGSVMQPEESAYQNKEGNGSLYRALFSFPYPMFRLKVKGFYGKGATYYLCPSDTAIELDASSGNFIITAKFVGMMYRIYADMPMSYISIAPYMLGGDEYWSEKVSDGTFAFVNRDGTTSQMIKFPELRRKIADAAFSEEKISAAAEGEVSIKDIDLRISLLKSIADSCPLHKWNIINKNGYYAATLPTEKKTIGEEIHSFELNVSGYDETYKTSYMSSFADILKYGTNKIENNLFAKDKYGYDNIVVIEYRKENGDKTHVPFAKNKDEYLRFVSGNTEAQKYISNFIAGNKNENRIFLFIFEGDFETANRILTTDLQKELDALLETKEKKEKEYREKEAAIVEKALGFTPSIKNIYNLAFAHMDTFMHVFYEHLKVIKSKMEPQNAGERKIELFNCDNDVSKEETILPPYPAFFAQKYASKGPTAPKTEIWPEEIPGGSGYALDEVNFVKDLLAATKLYQEAKKEADEAYEKARKRYEETGTGTDFTSQAPSTSVSKFIPLTVYDFVNKDKLNNPYAYLKSNEYSSDAIERNVFSTFALRAMYYLSTNNNNDSDNFGAFEAYNMAKAIGEDIADDKFWNFITNINKKDGGDAIEELQLDMPELKDNNGKSIGHVISSTGGKVTTELGEYYPIGEPNLLLIKKNHSVSKKENPNYVIQKEENTPEINPTFHFFESRDYIQEIYNSIDAEIDSTSDEADEKYDLKIRKKSYKRYKDNIDYSFDSDDISTMRGIVYTLEGKKTNLERIANDTYTDLMNNHYVKYPAIIDEEKGVSLFSHPFYNLQTTIEARAYLFLSAMPLKSQRKDGNQRSGIPKNSRNGVELKSVLLREGSFYWRQRIMQSGGGDPISTAGIYLSAATNETYIKDTNGWQAFWGDTKVMTVCPILKDENKKYVTWSWPEGATPSRAKKLEEMFLSFVKEYEKVESFLMDSNNYEDGKFSKGISAEAIKKNRDVMKFLNNTFFWVGTVLDYYVDRPVSDDKFVASKTALKDAFNSFLRSLKKIYKKDMKAGQDAAIMNAAIKKAEDPFNNNDLRLSTYLTLKSLYDKWLCSPFNGTKTWLFSAKDYIPESDFSKFVYIDSFYREIGKDLLVNITKVGDWLSSCLPTQNVETTEGSMRNNGRSVYEFLTEVAQHTGGMLMAFPQLIGGVSDEYMADMFKAMPFNSDWETDSSSFVFIYTYKPSEHIGMDQYEDDGFQLETEQARELLGGDGLSIPAFGVSYGKQNQSYFKNITLNTESNNVTEAAIGATLAIASKGSEGARETSLFGQDLYRVKTSYSYQCEFDMMGCVQIMPLMYFQLNNVPFWRGAYMVIKVSHQINAGDMTTHVVGVRINKNALPLTEGAMSSSKETGTAAQTETVAGAAVSNSGSEKIMPSNDNNVAGDPNAQLRGNMDYNEGNITVDKPIICLTPAHGPQTQKSAEWHWSSTLIDDYIIPKLSKLKFYDGTSYAENIQRCNKNGNNTGKSGYSTKETQAIIKKNGSLKVMSVVPHWNGARGKYFAVFPGYVDGSTSKSVMREDSSRFGDIMVEEAIKIINRSLNGEFKLLPTGAIMTSSSYKAQKKLLPVANSDGAAKLNCACVLTENWFADYRSDGGTYWVGDRSKLDASMSKINEKDANGRFKLMEGWLFSEEGLNAISDMHVEAIRRYINNLHERAKEMSTTNGSNAISEDMYARCASEIGCEVAALKAVRQVESGGKAFLAEGKPPILFEGHVFWRNLSNPQQNVAGNEDILYKNWTKKFYKKGLAEYDRLERAKAINETAALKSASWGLFQILGENFASCDCSSVQDFVKKMCESADNQLLLATKFICHNREMKNALVRKDWAEFARRYNGPKYAENKYDEKLRDAYNKLASA